MEQILIQEAKTSIRNRERIAVDGKFFCRGAERLRLQGVTYGPFAPGADGSPFPSPARVREDLAQMRDIGVNVIRTYHVPPEWLLDLADENGPSIFIDIPWSKHVCFLDNKATQRDACQRVRRVAEVGRNHACVLAYSIGNEIPFDIVRWHGAPRVERFLAELADVCRQTDANRLVTYANYPSTEYLNLSFLDFITFNVYLHDPRAFARYLHRLQNLAGDKPLVLGEIGMDTIRHGELEQAQFLSGHLRETVLMGLAGTFVFSWTDDWFTGGHQIDDWSFGLTRADRSPKGAYRAVEEIYKKSPAELLTETPRVSVVVCSYNGGRTLDQCLRSLLAIDYPDYEVILIDDGSTDDTRAIVEKYPSIRVIHQANRGLSAARNVGLKAATGSIIAYTDSDCFADPNWLALLIYQLQQSGAAGVGGPNLSPEDGWLAACVAASPGQPTHVLESDEIAEHIPGCNMAFRREALEAIEAFDPVYWKAGDDVDLCWRLQQAGYRITFAPGAFVWHHRRHNPRAYFRQQMGYGEAEALLQFKHPEKFTLRGNSKWRGVLYGASLQGLCLAQPMIYRGTFGAGLFQRVYRPDSGAWAMLPSTLEWHVAAAVVGLLGFGWHAVWAVFAVMWGLSVLVAALQAAQAHLAAKHQGLAARLLISALCYIQPLARSWKRYRTRIALMHAPADVDYIMERSSNLPWTGNRIVKYWTDSGRERTELLDQMVKYLTEHCWVKVIDSGWSPWDLKFYRHPWTAIQIRTVQENHGSGQRLICIHYRLRLTRLSWGIALIGLALTAVLAMCKLLPAALGLGLWAIMLMGVWRRGIVLASYAVRAFDVLAGKMRFARSNPHITPSDKAWASRQAGEESS